MFIKVIASQTWDIFRHTVICSLWSD